jgi:hypothetical protein
MKFKIGDIVEQRTELSPNVTLKKIGKISKIKGDTITIISPQGKILGTFKENELHERN